ncbi:MAG: hypothetical protein MR281_06805, partial [Eubacterium sp.]|nr:hypothetical protein [Eubacterium sp.]
YLIFHFAFAYFSNVICENLTSIAESEQYVKNGNEKVKLGTYFESFDTILDQSIELSKLAYEPENEDKNRKEELEKLGYKTLCNITINRRNYTSTFQRKIKTLQL